MQTTKSTEGHFQTWYQAQDKTYKMSRGVEIAKGWHVVNVNTGKELTATHPYASEDEAVTALPGFEAQRAERIAERSAKDTAAKHAAPARTYRTTSSSVYGTGRVYTDQPGATQYDDGTGRYGIQIWDN